jgi:arabinose-5-phosphate isomerase
VTEIDLRSSARRTLEIEANAARDLLQRVDDQFTQACKLILASSGKVIVTGMGKSGHIGNKIAATLASTGTPAHFVHPAEASHGDIGMIANQDVVLAISHSGNTEEITRLLPVLQRKNVPVIAITGDRNSDLAQAARFHLDGSVTEEACPLGLAPTTSTTVALLWGDALAMALLEARGFTRDDFAVSHPGGSLGRRLLVKVKDLMHAGDEIPRVKQTSPLSDALVEMTAKGFGLTTVLDDAGGLLGVFTDGDLRRALDRKIDINSTAVGSVIANGFLSVPENALAAEAARIMEEARVYVLLVTDKDGNLRGVIKMHDLLKAGVV